MSEQVLARQMRVRGFRMTPQRQAHELRQSLLAAIRKQPGTLAELVGHLPTVREATAVAVLLREGWVLRDVMGRYSVNLAPRTRNTAGREDGGRSVRTSGTRFDGRATGRKRSGHGG